MNERKQSGRYNFLLKSSAISGKIILLPMFRNNRNLVIIALVAVVNALGYGIIIPILYPYSVQFGLSDFQNGLLFAIFSICQFISTPLIGRLSDKYGRRPLLVTSISGTALSFVMMAFAPNAAFLFLARALDGITAGNIPVAMAVISDTTEMKDRAKGFGIIGASFSFGFISGPAISGFTVGYGTYVPFLIAAAISFLAVVITYFFLPETNKHLGEVKHGKLFDFKKLYHALRDENVGLTFVITLLFFFAFACAILYGFQPFTNKILRLSEFEVAMLFTLFGVVGLFAQVFFVARFNKWLGPKRAFTTAIFATALSFVIMFFSRSLPVFVVASVILGLFNSTVQTLIPTILSQETDAKSQGTVMGLNASYQSIGMIFGPIVGGAIAELSVPSPFMMGAFFVMICFFLSFHVLKPGIKKESAF
jgi:MFS family permease